MKTPDIKKITAANIRNFRKQAGFTQVELAERLNVSGRYVSMLERDPRNLSLESLARIAEVLKVTVCDLVCDTKQLASSKKEAAELAIDLLRVYLKSSE